MKCMKFAVVYFSFSISTLSELCEYWLTAGFRVPFLFFPIYPTLKKRYFCVWLVCHSQTCTHLMFSGLLFFLLHGVSSDVSSSSSSLLVTFSIRWAEHSHCSMLYLIRQFFWCEPRKHFNGVCMFPKEVSLVFTDMRSGDQNDEQSDKSTKR